jgi:nicotinamidase-related amidase
MQSAAGAMLRNHQEATFMNRLRSAWTSVLVVSLMLSLAACTEEKAVQHGPGTALVLIDMQTDYLNPQGKMPIAQNQSAPLIKTVNSLIQTARQRAFPVMYTMDQFSQFWLLHNIEHNFAAIRYSPGQKLDPQVDDFAGPYFTKDSENAFDNPEFASHLEGLDCGNLVIAGVFAGKSVLSSVKSALAAGYNVTVIGDAVGASSDEARSAALDELKAAGAKIETSAEFIGSAGA